MSASRFYKRQQGFTLIEVIASLVIAALAFAALANFFFNKTSTAIEPIFQMRAAKLGEALMDEILSRPYDEQTAVGGVPACGDVGADACTDSADFGLDAGETSRDEFDDVDDYNTYCGAPVSVVNALGTALGSAEDFDRFRMQICVDYDGDYDGAADNQQQAKLITVTIYPPSVTGVGQGPAIELKAYRSNF